MPDDTPTDKLFFALGQAQVVARDVAKPELLVLCTIIVRATMVLAEAIEDAGRDR
jgi:hypothetical protein